MNATNVHHPNRLSLLQGPIALPGRPYVLDLGTVVGAGDAVLTLTIARGERLLAYDGAGVREVRLDVVRHNGCVFYAGLGESQAPSTTAGLSGAAAGDFGIWAIGHGIGALWRATTEAVRAAWMTVHLEAVNRDQLRAGWREKKAEDRYRAREVDYVRLTDAGMLVDDDKVVLKMVGAAQDQRFAAADHSLDGLGLTEREREVAEWLVGGESPKGIADRLGRSIWSVYRQITNIKKKTGRRKPSYS